MGAYDIKGTVVGSFIIGGSYCLGTKQGVPIFVEKVSLFPDRTV